MPEDKDLKNLQPVLFVREGETLSKDNFAMMMKRFFSEMNKTPRKRDKNDLDRLINLYFWSVDC